MQFFRDLLQPRFPRTIGEGILKGFMVGALVLATYDNFAPTPKTPEEQFQHSARIVNGYFMFLLLGMILGYFGEENHAARVQPRRPGNL